MLKRMSFIDKEHEHPHARRRNHFLYSYEQPFNQLAGLAVQKLAAGMAKQSLVEVPYGGTLEISCVDGDRCD